MKSLVLSFLVLVTALVGPVIGQTPLAAARAPELEALVKRVQEKLRQKLPVAEFAPELAEFAALRKKWEQSQPAWAAQATYLEYTLQLKVFANRDAAGELRKILLERFRDHLAGTDMAREIEMEERMQAARAAQAERVGKPAPELNFIWSSEKGWTSLSQLRGKVVVLDFWATWCGPCIATFPTLRALAERYKSADVVVVGVTSVQGFVSGLTPARIDTRNDPAKEFALTADFIKEKEMTWPVVFTEQRVFNPDYGVQGIPHVAIIGPDGIVRHNGIHPGSDPAGTIEKIDQILASMPKSKTTGGE